MANILSQMRRFSIDKKPLDIQLELAAKLRILRKSANMSQAELANRSGVSLGSLKRFESTGRISLESLLQLVEILDRLSEFESLLLPKKDLSQIEKLFSNKSL